MIVTLGGRKVIVANERTERVTRALKRLRKNRNIRRELKHAGIGPSFPGNSLAFQTGENYFQTETETVSASPRMDSPCISVDAGMNQTVTLTVSRHRKIH